MDISIKCDSLKAIYSVKNGMLRCAAPYEFTISLMPMIKVCIEEVGNRIITFTCEEEIEAKMNCTDNMSNDVGTLLFGPETVEMGLMDEIGSLASALKKLRSMIK